MESMCPTVIFTVVMTTVGNGDMFIYYEETQVTSPVTLWFT